VPGAETAFEEMWRTRDSQLGKVEGFLSFRLLRGPTADDHTLYLSHTTWRDRVLRPSDPAEPPDGCSGSSGTGSPDRSGL
jgi:hypothetical protein